MSHNVVLKLKNKGKVAGTVELCFQTTTEETKRILGGSNELLDFELGLKRIAEVMDARGMTEVDYKETEWGGMKPVEVKKSALEIARLRGIVKLYSDFQPVWSWH